MEATATVSTGSSTIADLIAARCRQARRAARACATSATAPGTMSPTPSCRPPSQEIALGLIELGVEPGDRVCILANTRPEWTYADFAATSAGAVVVPIYQTNSPEECPWVIGRLRAPARSSARTTRSSPRSSRSATSCRTCRRVIVHRPTDTAIQRRLGGHRLLRDLARGAARARTLSAHAEELDSAPRRPCARGPLHVHLHLRHHRPAEGLRAHARQLPRDRRHDRARAARSPTTRSSTSTCRSRTPSRC